MARTTGTASLADLLADGVLHAGDELELRRRSAPAVTCRLLNGGALEVAGEIVPTPSRAAQLAIGDGRPADGWKRWHVVRLGGRTIEEVRAAHLAGAP